MKKFLALLLGIMIALFAVGCEDTTAIKLMAPDGAPGVVISKLVSDGKVAGQAVEAEIVAGADAISTNVANGTADMAVMPLNLAAKLYNGGVKIKLVSVNIFGSLYMVGKTDAITDLNSLKGKVVCNIGLGGTPDLTLKYILTQKGIPFEASESAVEGKVALRYVTAASELIPLLKTDKVDFGILGEPAVTNCNKNAGTSTVLDIQAEWKKITGESYTQAGFVVKESLTENKAFMNILTSSLAETKEWCEKNSSKIKETLVAKGSSLQIDYTAELIAKCNVGYVSAIEAKTDVESYFNVLMGFNAKLIGGKLPDSNFYYAA